jgi:flagellar hook protein FlgE
MIDSIFIALSGMQGHQRGLNVISNNVSNLNTPGFRGSTVSFADVFLGPPPAGAPFNQFQSVGGGVDATRTLLDPRAGQQQQTGRDLDLFIQGQGFFVLQGEDGGISYTRNGAFTFQDGVLVAADLKSKVMARNANGELVPIELGSLQVNPAKTTSSVTFQGDLSPNDSEFTIDSLAVFDKAGASHTLRVVFTKHTGPGTDTNIDVTWDIAVFEGADQIASSSVEFIANQLVGDGSLPMTLKLKGTDATTVTFNFSAVSGIPLGTSGGTAKTSTLAVEKQDGFASGTLTVQTFDANGVLKLTYSNGQTADGPKLVFAEIADVDSLTAIGNSQFVFHGSQPPVLRAAGDDLKVVSQSLEGSNVDLTREFSELVLMQRGYQASSEVLSTVNEMLQQLFDIRGQR